MSYVNCGIIPRFAGGTEESHEKSLSGYPISLLTLEQRTSRM